jgi:hypothetical protein
MFMEENNILPDCCDDDVVSFRGKLFKVGELRKLMGGAVTGQNQLPHTISNALRQQGLQLDLAYAKEFLETGVNGELLKIGSRGWRKGKIRMKVSLEFIADEQEEPEWGQDNILWMKREENR